MIPDVHRCAFFPNIIDLLCSDVRLSSRSLKACHKNLQGHSDHSVTLITSRINVLDKLLN